jgi:molybdopterin synthase sulfur carrier subunit
MVSVLIPAPLRKLTNDVDTVFVDGSTIFEVVDNLDFGYPGFKERVCTPDNQLRQFINIYVNQEDIRFSSGMATPVKDSDEVSIMPAIAGG